ncbi:hypothetical protein JTB14_032178 [Gonioctena quinquepunctata]|nr:hypothetical protein JTB14_032178 [Gonioctena quinquepunctata]
MSASVGMEISRLRVVLVALAQKHAINIKQNVNGTRTSLSKSCFSEDYERKLHQLLDSLPTEVYFEHIDRDSLWDGIADLLKSAETKFKPSENNIYVSSYSIPNTLQFQDRNLEIEWEILDTGNEEQVPLVYDVLSAIFYRTDSLGRQRHFHELVDFYYKSLEQSLQQHHLEISSVLPMDVYHNQIKKLSPFSKLSVLNIYCSREADGQRNTLLKEAISEMEECLLYCEHLLREDCYKILSTALSTTNYEFVKFKIIPVKERSGVLGDYLKLIISIKINTADEELNFFVKCLPTSFKGARDMALRVFKKEQFCYETFLSSLEQVGCEYITNFAPKCYFVRSNDVIVLEDLTIQGFAVKNMFVSPVEYKWLTLAVKQLAKLHACSVVLEEKMSEKIGRTFRCDEEFGEYLEEELYTDIDEYESMISCGFREAIRFLDKFPDIPKRITLEEFKHRMKRSINAVYEDIKKSSHVRNVVNHGDTWCNNFMFKTDEKKRTYKLFFNRFPDDPLLSSSFRLAFLHLYQYRQKNTRAISYTACGRLLHGV